MFNARSSLVTTIAWSIVWLGATAIHAQVSTASAYGNAGYSSGAKIPKARVVPNEKTDVFQSATKKDEGGRAVSDDCAEVRSQLTRIEVRLKDWAALARYREANSKVAGPVKKEGRVVFMGDSITDWWVRPTSGGFFPGKPYIDRGISGQRTDQMLIRFRPDVIALKPKVVVILAGTNDLASVNSPLQAISDNLTSMVDLARESRIRVVLASLLPVSDYGKDKAGKPIIQTDRRVPEQIKAANKWIKKYAAENDLTYLDYYTAMVDEKGLLRADLSDDGLHPNARGYAVMSPLAEQAIARALKK